jgi:HJR/Mrr/RecB family endonuclease
LIAGELLGAGEDILLPKLEKVEQFLDESGGELEAVGRGEHVWACELKWRRSAAGETEVKRLLERAGKAGAERAWLISRAGFTKEARALLRKKGILHSNGDQFREIEKAVRRET